MIAHRQIIASLLDTTGQASFLIDRLFGPTCDRSAESVCHGSLSVVQREHWCAHLLIIIFLELRCWMVSRKRIGMAVRHFSFVSVFLSGRWQDTEMVSQACGEPQRNLRRNGTHDAMTISLRFKKTSYGFIMRHKVIIVYGISLTEIWKRILFFHVWWHSCQCHTMMELDEVVYRMLNETRIQNASTSLPMNYIKITLHTMEKTRGS